MREVAVEAGTQRYNQDRDSMVISGWLLDFLSPKDTYW